MAIAIAMVKNMSMILAFITTIVILIITIIQGLGYMDRFRN